MLRGSSRRIEHVVTHLAVLAPQVRPVLTGRHAEELEDGRRHVDEARRPRHQAIGTDTLAAQHERCACLHDPERAVLAAVAALVLPVVVGRVQDAQVGCRRVVEQLGDVVEREGVRVLVAAGVEVGPLVGKRGEAVGRLVGERVGAGGLEHLVGPVAAPEPHRPVVGPGLVRTVAGQEDHVDDRLQRRVGQDLEGSLGLVDPVARELGDRRSAHRPRAYGRSGGDCRAFRGIV